MKLCIKRFDELTADELYGIIELREKVFVVEQNCPYLDADGLDKNAIHLWYEDDEGVQAYLRILERGAESEYVSIGRVVTSKRRSGLGTSLMKDGIRAARKYMKADHIYLEGQVYVEEFYKKLGFKRISEEFLLDGIPHVKMLL